MSEIRSQVIQAAEKAFDTSAHWDDGVPAIALAAAEAALLAVRAQIEAVKNPMEDEYWGIAQALSILDTALAALRQEA